MRGLLQGSTALIAVGALLSAQAAAQGIKLGLGGYMNNFFSFGEIDGDGAFSGDDFNPTSLRSDGEIHFRGEFLADNGLSFGVEVELESFQSDPDQIDQNYAYVEGAFGRLEAGSVDSAAYLMQYSSPNVGIPINSGWVTDFIPDPGAEGLFFAPGGSTYVDIGDSENRLTYFTPRVAGFQFGASYTPTVNEQGDGSNNPANEGNDTRNALSFGINFVDSFGGVEVALAGGLQTAERGDAVSGENGEPKEDIYLYSTGLNVSYAGLTIGASGAVQSGGGAAAGRAFDVGLSYTDGPWSFGVTYFNGQSKGSTGRNGGLKAVSGGAEYELAPGVTLNGAVFWAELEGASDSNDDGVETADEFGRRDGVVGAVGIRFTF